VRYKHRLPTFTLSFATRADAVFSTIAAACVPGDPAIQANRYFVTAGSVKHQQGATGLITLYCPFPVPPPINEGGGGTNGGLFMTYSVTGETAQVSAALLRVDQSGNFSPVLGLNGKPIRLNSSDFGGTGTEEQPFSFTYEYFNFYYYVRVDINRSDESSTAIFYGVGFETLIPPFGEERRLRKR
jgi:hypothetical protein